MSRFGLLTLLVCAGLSVAGCPNQPAGDTNENAGNVNGNSGGSDQTNQNTNEGDTVAPPAEPIATLPDLPAPVESAPQAAAGATTLLNEVRFLARDGDVAFVELRIGQSGPPPASLALENETGARFDLPDGLADPGAGGLVVVLFDGGDSTEATVVHAGPASFLNAVAGVVRLLDAAGSVLDQVAWGAEQENPVPLNRGGGIGDDEPEPGVTLARYADSTAGQQTAWCAIPPNWASPGAPNPNPGVPMLLPQSGSILPPGDVQLSWYPEPHAASYDLEVSTSEAFDSFVAQSNVFEPLTTIALTANKYFWRVRAVSPDGSLSDWAPASVLFVEERPDAAAGGAPKLRGRTQAGSQLVSAQIAGFPSISQHKDSPMLLLESLRNDANHRWDAAHTTLDAGDPADNMNCTLASVQMVNKFYGGNLTQDRIGYELHRNDQKGPERDLNYGAGNLPDKALWFALSGVTVPPVRANRATYLGFWNDVKEAIDDQRPVVAVVRSQNNGSHTEVIVGYEIDYRVRPPQFNVVVENPWWPGSATAYHNAVEFSLFSASLFSYYVIPSGVRGTQLEAELSANPIPDADGDGIIDFDEKNRFGTAWQNKPADSDSDKDCRRDKDEILWSMRDPKWGYAYAANYAWVGHARMGTLTLTTTGVPIRGRPELDIDGDGGGLPDFAEDLNFNGARESDGTESNAFSHIKPPDDLRSLTGTYTERRFLKFAVNGGTNPGDSDWEQSDLRVDATYDLQTQPDGTVRGTATITHKASVASHSIPGAGETCNPIEYHIVDRSWTSTVTGTWSCDGVGGGRVMLTLKYGSENASIPISIIDGCLNAPYGGGNPWFQEVAAAGLGVWNRERAAFWYESISPLTDRDYYPESESYARLELKWK